MGSLLLGLRLIVVRSARKERNAIWRDFADSHLLSAGEGNHFAGELDGTPVVAAGAQPRRAVCDVVSLTPRLLRIGRELMPRHGLSVARGLRKAAGAMTHLEQLQAGSRGSA